MDTGLKKEDYLVENETKKREVVATTGSVILRIVDDNVYQQESLKPEEAGKLMREAVNVNTYEYKGEVVSVGPGVKSDVSVGDYVHHAKHAGTVFTFAGENLLKLEEYLICGIEKK